MAIPQPVKRLGLSAVASAASPVLSRWLLRNHGVIFMLHRFSDPARGVVGHDPDGLRRSLGYLRRRRFDIVSLEDIIRSMERPSPPVRGAVAFTIDDGYLDQARVGAQVFAEFDCPVTIFVTTGFLDGTLWFWWDQIMFVFKRTARRQLRVHLGARSHVYQWKHPRESERSALDFITHCKKVADSEKHRAIAELAAAADVELPSEAPAEYAPMSWEDVRVCERRGMSFAPHTVTHPILSRTTDSQAEQEIAESWDRLRSEATAPTSVFCYPNGQPGDFSQREFRILTRVGMSAAVVGTPGYAALPASGTDTNERFQIPRFAWPHDTPTMAQYVVGVERIKDAIRRAL